MPQGKPEQWVPVVHKGRLGPQGKLELQEPQVPRVRPVSQAAKASPVLPVLQGRPAKQESLDRRACRVLRGPLGPPVKREQ